MPRTTDEYFEWVFGDIDDFLSDAVDFEQSVINIEIEKSWRQIEQSYYEELAEESDMFEIYRQDEDEDGII